MKKKYKLLSGILLLLAIILVSCSSDSTGPEDDTIAPTVSILDIPYGASFSGIFSVTVYVNDDNNVDTVALYLDGQNIASTTSSPYIFYVNCNDVEDGVHTLQAKAQDEAGNIGESEFVAINTTYDFAPYSNGQIRVSITNYQQLDQLDLSSFGDPYFVYIIKIDEFLINNSFHTNKTISYIMNEVKSIDIDTQGDLENVRNYLWKNMSILNVTD